MAQQLPSKDPLDSDWYYIAWCDKTTGLNDGSAADHGILQSATITTATWTLPTGITKVAESLAAVSIHGIAFSINTVTAIKVSGGTNGTPYTLACLVVTSDGRTLNDNIIIPVVTN